MTLIEAAKQALEALESAEPKYTRQRKDQKTLGGALDYWKLAQHQRLKAITALQEALADQPEQEPVAITITGKLGNIYSFAGDYSLKKGDKVYTAPPQRTWVGLTDEEIEDIEITWEATQEWACFRYAARAIEAKLKEKNT